MNNNLLTKAQNWLAELGIRTEAAGTYLKINREDVLALFNGTENERTRQFMIELKSVIGNKLYLDKGTVENYHLNSF